MTITYDKIATTTLGSTASSVTFSSITGSYTDLVLIVNASGSEGSSVYLQYNGDTGSNYSFTSLAGDGSGTESGRGSNSVEARVGSATSGGPHYVIADIMNYSNTTTYKTGLSKAGRHGNAVYTFANLWRSTSAITSLTVNLAYGSFQIGGTFTLYGILKA